MCYRCLQNRNGVCGLMRSRCRKGTHLCWLPPRPPRRAEGPPRAAGPPPRPAAPRSGRSWTASATAASLPCLRSKEEIPPEEKVFTVQSSAGTVFTAGPDKQQSWREGGRSVHSDVEVKGLLRDQLSVVVKLRWRPASVFFETSADDRKRSR